MRRFCAPHHFTRGVRSAFQSKAFAVATKDLEKTPNGKNPYDVLDITVSNSTTLDDVKQQFKTMAVRYHPDREGGSHEKMSELNAAYKIVKENHNTVLKNMSEAESNLSANKAYRTHQNNRRRQQQDEMGRNGGLQSQARQNVRSVNMKNRSPKEIQAAFEAYREEVEGNVKRMALRYEYAVDVATFFRRSNTITEMTVRERWLRKTYLKGVWEDVHEMRTELLKRGSKNMQVTQLAEDLVAFAQATQQKLNDDFDRTTQVGIRAQSHMFLKRAIYILGGGVLFVKGFAMAVSGTFNSSLVVQLREATMGY